MLIDRKLLYLNMWALTLNAILVCLTLFKHFPFLLPVAVIVVSMAGCLWIALKVNRPLLKEQTKKQ